MKVKLLTSEIQINHQTDIAIGELANCYQSENMTFDKLVNIAMVRKHEGVLEWFDLAFNIKDISYASHVHFLRHRHCSFLVQSQRYTKSNLVIAPIKIMDAFMKDKKLVKKYKNMLDAQGILIRELWGRGISKEDTRYLDCQGTTIEMGLKCNLREFLHIQKLRNAPEAMPETRQCAQMMLDECLKIDKLRRLLE